MSQSKARAAWFSTRHSLGARLGSLAVLALHFGGLGYWLEDGPLAALLGATVGMALVTG